MKVVVDRGLGASGLEQLKVISVDSFRLIPHREKNSHVCSIYFKFTEIFGR